MINSVKESSTADLLLRYYDKNDEKALSEFFLQFKDVVFRIAFSVLGNLADAEDITQQIFVLVMKKKAVCKAAYEKNDQKVKSWLLTITYNACRMQYNATKKKRNVEISLGAEVEATEKEQDNNHTNDQSILSKVNKAIFELPDKYRVPIIMRYQEEMTVQEISKTLASPQTTIRSILSRGIAQLRSKLAGEAIVISTLATIKYITQIQSPNLQKDMTISLINSIKPSNPHVHKAFEIGQSKNGVIFLKTSLVAVACGAMAIGAFLYLVNNSSSQTAPNSEHINLTNKSHWDFSKENGSDLVAIQSKLLYNSETKAISDLPNNVELQDAKIATIIKLPTIISNPVKINIKSNSLISRMVGENYFCSLEFVPCLENNQIVNRELLYNAPYALPYNLKQLKEDHPSTQTFYIFNDVCISTYNGVIIKVQRYTIGEQETYAGLLLNNYSVEKIEIVNLDETEGNTIRDSALKLFKEVAKTDN